MMLILNGILSELVITDIQTNNKFQTKMTNENVYLSTLMDKLILLSSSLHLLQQTTDWMITMTDMQNYTLLIRPISI